MTSSLNTDDLTVIPQLDLTVPLVAALLVCLAVMIAAIVLAVVLSRPRRKPRVSAARGVHAAATGKSVWRNRINAIVEGSRQQRHRPRGGVPASGRRRLATTPPPSAAGI